MALIKDKNEVKKQLPVAYAKGTGTLPNVELAEERYLVPVLGRELYDTLVSAYDDADPLSETMKKLLIRCQAVIVPMAYFLDLPFIQTLLSDNGLIALESENSRKAYKWEFNTALEALQDRGYAAQEALILFLRTNREDYPLWDSSPYNSADAFAIIRDGGDLGSVIRLQQPHRCFLLLQPLFNVVAELYLIPALGEEYYTALSNRIRNGGIGSEEKYVLAKLRMAAGRLAMTQAATEMNVRFGAAGFTIVDIMRDTPEEGRKNAPDRQLMRFREEMEKSGQALLQQTVEYLNGKASAAVFPEYYNSSAYSDPATGTNLRPDNGKFKGFFVS